MSKAKREPRQEIDLQALLARKAKLAGDTGGFVFEAVSKGSEATTQLRVKDATAANTRRQFVVQ